mmetsp:Transcript_9119/g.17865  ORF Transcript_9119/g.17865 Transcript_9119/m.17865 type:complete len:128 (-) Transcript_9119:645-1028(-)
MNVFLESPPPEKIVSLWEMALRATEDSERVTLLCAGAGLLIHVVDDNVDMGFISSVLIDHLLLFPAVPGLAIMTLVADTARLCIGTGLHLQDEDGTTGLSGVFSFVALGVRDVLLIWTLSPGSLGSS